MALVTYEERDGIAVQPELDFAPPLLTAATDELETVRAWLAQERKYPDRPDVLRQGT